MLNSHGRVGTLSKEWVDGAKAAQPLARHLIHRAKQREEEEYEVTRSADADEFEALCANSSMLGALGFGEDASTAEADKDKSDTLPPALPAATPATLRNACNPAG